MTSRNQFGFTLIEVLISIMILATLTVFTAQSIQSALQTSKKYRAQIDEASELRDVLRIIESDINVAFHYRDIDKEMSEAIKKENQSKNENNGNAPNIENPNQPERPNYTEFKGEKDSLHFTSLGNARTLMDAQESDQAEVGYFLQPCKARSAPTQSVNCLWRRLAPVIDNKVDEGGQAMVLIEDVHSFKLRYVGQQKEEEEINWLDRWMSGPSGDDRTRGRFPLAVQIELSINRHVGKKTLQQAMTAVASIRFPNNKEEKAAEKKDGTNAVEEPAKN